MISFRLLAIFTFCVVRVVAQSRMTWLAVDPDLQDNANIINTLRCVYYNTNSTNMSLATHDHNDLVFLLSDTEEFDLRVTVVMNCVDTHAPHLTVAVRVDTGDDDGLTNIGELASIANTAPADLQITPLVNNNGRNSTLMARDKYAEHYYLYASLDDDCVSNELFVTESDICQDTIVQGFYYYMIAYNDPDLSLIVNTFYHHRCDPGSSKKDYQVTRLAPSGFQGCTKQRTFYSWFGAFSGDECYTHESAPNCSQWQVDEWLGFYVPGVTNIGGQWWIGYPDGTWLKTNLQ